MLPPPNNNNDDSLLQHLDKLSARPHVRYRRPVTGIRAPPPYTAGIPSQGQEYDDDYYEEYDHDYDDDAVYDYENTAKDQPYPARIIPPPDSKTLTINLNSSVQINGDGNTIVIATGLVNHHPHPQRSSDNPDANDRPSPGSKLANTTAAIVAALQRSGVYPSSSTSSPLGCGSGPASVTIDIDAGVRVDGARNVVCFGSAASLPAAVAAGGRSRTRETGTRTGTHNVAGRKRRAQSVCLPPLSFLTFSFGIESIANVIFRPGACHAI
ncbi:uncharacterized protein BJX67DRAFT_269146 [Aspergillus lucknowensis]|uniref:Uncharacterized protein n=1 Tax=Aspergillus lucknowensis TaxID=176173 RepID=A0ABR4LET3_9EURO